MPFNISCGHCFMCDRQLYAQCETTQVREYDKGAALFGYTKLYGQVPGGQAEYLRVPQAHFGPIKVPEEAEDAPDERFLYLSDILPTAWQAVDYADIPEEGHGGRVWTRPGRAVLRPNRPPPGRTARLRRRPCAREARDGAPLRRRGA
jgi:threonine dehydrogenase-like Zn-dependent dehydrogenase